MGTRARLYVGQGVSFAGVAVAAVTMMANGISAGEVVLLAAGVAGTCVSAVGWWSNRGANRGE